MLDHVSSTRKQEDVKNRSMVANDQAREEFTTAHSYATSRQVASGKDKGEAFARFSHSFIHVLYTGDCVTSETHDLERGRELAYLGLQGARKQCHLTHQANGKYATFQG